MALRNLGAAFYRLSLTRATTRNTQWSGQCWFQNKQLPLPVASTTPKSLILVNPVGPAANSQCLTFYSNGFSLSNLLNSRQPLFTQARGVSSSLSCLASLYQMHRTGPIKKKRKNKNPLGNKPFARGIVLKTLIKKPKKPNSANRKCVLVRLSIGKEMIAYVPGEGHNLQEHNIVLVRPGRLRDTPGVKLKCVRGKYDLPHVIKKQQP